MDSRSAEEQDGCFRLRTHSVPNGIQKPMQGDSP